MNYQQTNRPLRVASVSAVVHDSLGDIVWVVGEAKWQVGPTLQLRKNLQAEISKELGERDELTENYTAHYITRSSAPDL